jgi:hypothetical protein
LSYDITAWALPLAYGVEGYALKNTIAIKTKASIEVVAPIIQKCLWFYIPWNNRISVQVLSILHQKTSK